MLKSMPVRLFNDWIAYSCIEPFGEERADLRQAITSAIIARTMGGVRNPKLKNYMPDFGKQARLKRKKKGLSVEEISTFFTNIAEVTGRVIGPNGNDQNAKRSDQGEDQGLSESHEEDAPYYQPRW